MVIRRIREHVTAHNWFAVAIDLGIVVAGVIIATQVNNWNEARQDRERGHNYSIRLMDELRTTEQSMRGIRLYYADVRDHALAALAVLRKQGSAPDESFLVDAYQATQVFPRAARHATYDEILQSGSLELVGSPDLRARLSNYYWRRTDWFRLTQCRHPIANGFDPSCPMRCSKPSAPNATRLSLISATV